MTAPTVPTAPLPSELEKAIDRTDAELRVLPKKLGYTNLELDQDWQTIREHLLTIQREREEAQRRWSDSESNLAACDSDLQTTQERLAASERTCAELRASVERSVAGMNALSAQSVQLVDENAKLRARAEAAERTVEGLRERGDVEVCCAQAVEFAEYVTEHAKGKMVDAAQRFLSLPYSQELAAKLKRAPSA